MDDCQPIKLLDEIDPKKKKEKKRPCIKKKDFFKTNLPNSPYFKKNEIIGFLQQVPEGSQIYKKNSHNLSTFHIWSIAKYS